MSEVHAASVPFSEMDAKAMEARGFQMMLFMISIQGTMMSSTFEPAGVVAGGEKKRSGRRKTELKFIEKESARQVTFSKRKLGLFKKAGHLSLMSGDVEVAVLILSNKGKPYSFGSPSADAVIHRYLHGGAADRALEVVPATGSPEGGGRDVWWWLEAVEGMGEEDLGKYREFLEKLKMAIQERMVNLQVMH